jgi:hypothetical protein
MWTPPKKDRCDSCPDGPEIPKKDCGHSTTMVDLNCPVCVEVHRVGKIKQPLSTIGILESTGSRSGVP